MKLFLILCILPFFSVAQSKSLKAENEKLVSQNLKLKSENDSLRLALKKCAISNQMFLMTLNREEPTFDKEKKLTAAQKEKLLLAKLNSAPDSIKGTVNNLKTKVDSFVQYCQNLKEKLVQEELSFLHYVIF